MDLRRPLPVTPAAARLERSRDPDAFPQDEGNADIAEVSTKPDRYDQAEEAGPGPGSGGGGGGYRTAGGARQFCPLLTRVSAYLKMTICCETIYEFPGFPRSPKVTSRRQSPVGFARRVHCWPLCSI